MQVTTVYRVKPTARTCIRSTLCCLARIELQSANDALPSNVDASEKTPFVSSAFLRCPLTPPNGNWSQTTVDGKTQGAHVSKATIHCFATPLSLEFFISTIQMLSATSKQPCRSLFSNTKPSQDSPGSNTSACSTAMAQNFGSILSSVTQLSFRPW